MFDPSVLMDSRRQILLEEAAHERLLRQLPRSERPRLRRSLALACHRLADWLDGSDSYVRLPRSGPAYWVSPSLRG